MVELIEPAFLSFYDQTFQILSKKGLPNIIFATTLDTLFCKLVTDHHIHLLTTYNLSGIFGVEKKEVKKEFLQLKKIHNTVV